METSGKLCYVAPNDEMGEHMTPELLRLAGEALFGPQWQAPVARALNISPRHISRVMSPDYKDRPTERYRTALIGMLQAKVTDATHALRVLETTDENGDPLIPGMRRK